MGNNRSKLRPPRDIKELITSFENKGDNQGYKNNHGYTYNDAYVIEYLDNHFQGLPHIEILQLIMTTTYNNVDEPRTELFDIIFDRSPELTLETFKVLVNYITKLGGDHQFNNHVLTKISDTIKIVELVNNSANITDELVYNYFEVVNFICTINNTNFKNDILDRLGGDIRLTGILCHHFTDTICRLLKVSDIRFRNNKLTDMLTQMNEFVNFDQSETAEILLIIIEHIYQSHITDFSRIDQLIIKFMELPQINLCYQTHNNQTILHYLTGRGYVYNPSCHMSLRKFLEPLAIRLIRKLPISQLNCENNDFQTALGNAKAFQLHQVVLELEKHLSINQSPVSAPPPYINEQPSVCLLDITK